MRREAMRVGDRGCRPPQGAPRPAMAGALLPSAERARTVAMPRTRLQRGGAPSGEAGVGLVFGKRSQLPLERQLLAARQGLLRGLGSQKPVYPRMRTLHLPATARTRRSVRPAHQTPCPAGAPPGGTLRGPHRHRRGARPQSSAPPTRACSTSTRPRCCPVRRPAGRQAAAAQRCGGTWRPSGRPAGDDHLVGVSVMCLRGHNHGILLIVLSKALGPLLEHSSEALQRDVERQESFRGQNGMQTSCDAGDRRG